MARSKLCSNHGPLDIIDEEGHGMEVGILSMTCLSVVERSFARYASFAVPGH